MNSNNWETILFQNIGLSQIAKNIPNIPDSTPSPVKGSLLAMLLPSLCYLVLVATLDEVLSDYIDVKNIPWSKGKKQNLYNRIDLISSRYSAINKKELHKIRKRRNSIAHEPDLILTNPITWDEYHSAIDCICSNTKEIGIISRIPDITSFFERNPTYYLDELSPNGERICFDYNVGVKLDGEIFMEYKQTISHFPPT